MLTLYYKPTCLYSQAVLGEVENLGLALNLKDVSTDVILQAEVMEKGGKMQTPFLFDPQSGVSMYDSKDIVEYLYAQQADVGQKESFGGLRIHKSDEACDTCQ